MKYGKNLSFLRGMGPTACSQFFEEKKIQISHKCWKSIKSQRIETIRYAVVFNLNGINYFVDKAPKVNRSRKLWRVWQWMRNFDGN
jgi:hypothetical protein